MNDLTIIVPVKAQSERCPNKNFRPFTDDGRSLLDLKLAQLARANVSNSAVTIATNSYRLIEKTRFATIDDTGHNATFAQALDYWISQVATPELAIVHVTCPLFDTHELRRFFAHWQAQLRNGTDSMFTGRRARHFLIEEPCRPVNFQFGAWHGAGSCSLKPLVEMTCAAFAITTEEARHCRYYIGRRPSIYMHGGSHIDIDTENDFRLAQILYREQQCQRSQSQETARTRRTSPHRSTPATR